VDGGAAAHADEADAKGVRHARGALSGQYSGGEHVEGKGECGEASVSGDTRGVEERGRESFGRGTWMDRWT